MKKQEKTELTRERIIRAAVQEFGTNGYALTTVNAICGNHAIAKGLLYHNFKGKDGLYLACVSLCFDEVIAYLKTRDVRNDLQEYMQARFRYFSEHPLWARIFFEAVLQPPAALSDSIKIIKEEFDEFNRSVYRAALSRLPLREGVTEADAMEYYESMQEMFNGYYNSPAYEGKGLESAMADHECRLAKILDFMLYGIAERKRDSAPSLK